jgi:hypothetical protein
MRRRKVIIKYGKVFKDRKILEGGGNNGINNERGWDVCIYKKRGRMVKGGERENRLGVMRKE